jgi:hypothetical protein
MRDTAQEKQPARTTPAAQRQAPERGGHLSTQLASSPRQLAQRRLIGQMLGSAVQRVEGELVEQEGGAAQLRSEPVQRVEGGLDEEEPPAAAQLLAEPAQLEENRTGMPDGLKAGIESLSGMDMSDVRVHRNSSQPAQLNALAYAQGNDIHLGPGQEQHLPHEAWHVVQQRQGRVPATMQMAGVGVNDDAGLEREADVMGGRAVQLRGDGNKKHDLTPNHRQRVQAAHLRGLIGASPAAVQRVVLSKVLPLINGGTKTVYYSSHDGYSEFDCREEAEKHDRKRSAQAQEFQYNDRVPTNFTYHQTDARNVVSSSNQGPHSLSHSSLAFRLKQQFQNPSVDVGTLRQRQILSPQEFSEQFKREAPCTAHPNQVLRAETDYALLNKQLDRALDQQGPRSLVMELIMRLMQMNPYTAYGKAKQGQARMKNKGEREDDSFDDALDGKASFRDSKGFDGYKKRRRELYGPEPAAQGGARQATGVKIVFVALALMALVALLARLAS